MGVNVEGTRIDVQSDDGVSVIALVGEFDLARKDELQQQFQALREANRRRVVLDLSRTRFLDSTVLGALVRAHQDGLGITIRGASGIALKALEVTGLTALFNAEDAPFQQVDDQSPTRA
jgi:anti-anti-sigma factor